KIELEHVSFRRPAYCFSGLQVAGRVLGAGTTLAATAMLTYFEYQVDQGTPLATDTTYVDPQRRFQFDVVGNGWKIVPIGTYSDGTAELELQGRLMDMHAMVFAVGGHDTLQAMTTNRISENERQLSNSKCTERRTLERGKLNVVSTVHCEGRNLLERQLEMHRFVETEQGTYELYASLSAQNPSVASAKNPSFASAKEDISRMLESFATP
ncbi:MAG: hypothetical protein ACR2RL_17195, partial [Gammaproteobacteria bacterium]